MFQKNRELTRKEVALDSPDDGFRLLSDQPLIEITGEDILGTAAAATRLADLIAASRESAPFTLAIDADWGMGKSSLMLLMRERLEAEATTSGIRTAWFNAWTAGDSQALDGLIKSVMLSLDENILRRGLRKVTSKNQLMTAIRVTFTIAASFFHLSRVVDDLWARLSVDAAARNEIRARMADIFAEWSARSARAPDGKTLVIFVDDLDRCSSEVILEICEAIKLYLDVPGIVFVLGCDQSVLGRAILDSNGPSRTAANANYLEKIIQVTYTKPAPFNDQAAALVARLAAESATEVFFNDAVTSIVVDQTGRNPRRIKRLINSLILEYRLDPGWQEFGAESLVSVLLLRQFYADFYRLMVNPAADDIASEFLAYLAIREQLRHSGRPTDADRRYFAEHQVRQPGEQYSGEDLGNLEQELPVSFPALAHDADFTSLLRNLSGRDDFSSLRHRLQRHPAPALRLDQPWVNATPLTAELELTGLEVLWLSTDRAATAGEPAIISSLGAIVRQAASAEEASQLLLERAADAVVAEIGVGTDESAGLDAVREITSRYEGPLICFTSRLTPSRQREAENLGARMTGSPVILLDYLRAIANRRETPAITVTGPRSREQADPATTWSGRKGLASAGRWSAGEL